MSTFAKVLANAIITYPKMADIISNIDVKVLVIYNNGIGMHASVVTSIILPTAESALPTLFIMDPAMSSVETRIGNTPVWQGIGGNRWMSSKEQNTIKGFIILER